jgi:ornithine--oxo-acid transaminase
VPFGDLDALEKVLATRRIAAFIVEPIQAEGGIRMPTADYLGNVRKLCRRHGTLLVLDEVQTGMYRTGPFLASETYQADPDMVVLAKALSGGLIPSGALLMTDDIYDSVYGSLRRAIVHTSTFSENGLAMRAGLATLEVLERDRLGERAAALGAHLRERLREALSGYEMVEDVRGTGMLNGVQFAKPKSLRLRLAFEAFQRIHAGMFGQVVVMRMFREGFLTQICGNNFMVLKAAPPLVAEQRHVDEFVRALKAVVDEMHCSAAFWTEALGMARRVAGI